jgi:hypothetical protein
MATRTTFSEAEQPTKLLYTQMQRCVTDIGRHPYILQVGPAKVKIDLAQSLGTAQVSSPHQSVLPDHCRVSLYTRTAKLAALRGITC